MQAGRGGMGSHKHGISGYPTRSPRYRFRSLLEARSEDARHRECIRRKRRLQQWQETIRDLMDMTRRDSKNL